MTKQVLDVQQMQHLQKLGLELKETTLIYAGGGGKYGLFLTRQIDKILWKSTYPAYTLQDVLDALPESILKNDIQYWLSICRVSISIWMISYSDDVDLTTNLHHEEYESLIDAAYSMLCWAIENKFVETNKNE